MDNTKKLNEEELKKASGGCSTTNPNLYINGDTPYCKICGQQIYEHYTSYYFKIVGSNKLEVSSGYKCRGCGVEGPAYVKSAAGVFYGVKNDPNITITKKLVPLTIGVW